MKLGMTSKLQAAARSLAKKGTNHVSMTLAARKLIIELQKI